MSKDPTPTPTPEQQRALCLITHRALEEIKYLCRRGLHEQAEHLADVVHELPRQIYGGLGFSWEYLEADFGRYRDRWVPLRDGGTGYFWDYAALVQVARDRPGELTV